MSDNPRELLKRALPTLEFALEAGYDLGTLVDEIRTCLEPPAASPDAPFPDSRDNSTCECLTGEEVKFGR